MKKPHFSILVAITLLFCGFLLGFLFGRTRNTADVIVSVPSQMTTMPRQETTAEKETEPATEPIQYPIDINTADKQTLMILPGIGEVLAQRIITYRETHGAFSHVTDLMNVDGIGQTRMEDILDYVTAGG